MLVVFPLFIFKWGQVLGTLCQHRAEQTMQQDEKIKKDFTGKLHKCTQVKIHLHCLGGSSSFSLCLLYSSPWLKARCSTKQRYSWCAFCFLLKLKFFYAFYLDIPSNLAVFRQPFPHSVIFWSMRGNKQHPSLSPPCPTTSQPQLTGFWMMLCATELCPGAMENSCSATTLEEPVGTAVQKRSSLSI